MSTFKAGDIVRCINADERFGDSYEIDLTVGKLYKVMHVSINVVTIEQDDDGQEWNYIKDRFINVKEERSSTIDEILD